MPIKHGSQDIPRLKHGNQTIRRAYQGNNLVYGLYDVHYYDRNNIDTYEPKEYAGGYAPECVNFLPPLNAPDYVLDGYPTHFGDSVGTNGWYSNNSLTLQKNKIELDDKEDLDMYARWRQHKYAYSGVITYEVGRWEDDPGPGPQPFTPIPQGEYTAGWLISNGYYSTTCPGVDNNWRPQCTGNVAARLCALGSGYIRTNTGRWWYYDSGLPTGQTPKAGAIACGYTDEYHLHNAFVETVLEDGSPVFCHGNGKGSGTYPVETVCVTTSGPGSFAGEFLGYVYTDLCQ